jgi:uncharacterized protein YjbI with pentapeptide repeats
MNTIEIKNRFTGNVIFSYHHVDNTIAITLSLAASQQVNLSGASLSGADLSRADLSGADLSRADLSRADLSGADLSGANLYGSKLSKADLSGASLSGADLSETDLSGADLSRADLSKADLFGAYLSGANLSRADLSGATYGEATFNLGFKQLSGLRWNVFFFDTHIKIGCKFYSTEEWTNFSEDEIDKMEADATAFCEENKQLILGIAMIHQGFKTDASGKFVSNLNN